MVPTDGTINARNLPKQPNESQRRRERISTGSLHKPSKQTTKFSSEIVFSGLDGSTNPLGEGAEGAGEHPQRGRNQSDGNTLNGGDDGAAQLSTK